MTSRNIRTATRFLFASSALAISIAAPAHAAPSWSDITITNGTATVTPTNSTTTTINQTSTRAIGTARDLSIRSGDTVTINQAAGAGSLFVAKTTSRDGSPSRILGTLNANGNVMVLDGDGVFFGSSARIDVGGIIASTGTVNDREIMDGGKFDITNRAAFIPLLDGRTVENRATINVKEAGLVAFVAPNVINDGVINAKLGRVALAAGERVTVDMNPGNPLVEVALNERQSRAIINNKGTINAEGGTIQITAEAGRNVLTNAINLSGVIDASSATVKGGKIILGGKNTTVKTDKATIKANGVDGGSVNVDAHDINIDKDTKISANGRDGSVRLFATDDGSYKGRYESIGGRVETSALGDLELDDNITVLATEWIIDPIDIFINSSMANIISNALNLGTSTTVKTAAPGSDAGDITLGDYATIQWNTAANLKLVADNNVILRGKIISDFVGAGNQGSVTLTAGNSIVTGPTAFNTLVPIAFEYPRQISTKGGDITFDAGNDILLGQFYPITLLSPPFPPGFQTSAPINITSTSGNIKMDAGRDVKFVNYDIQTNNAILVQTTNGNVDITAGRDVELRTGARLVNGILINGRNVNVDAGGSVKLVNNVAGGNLARIAAGKDITIKSGGAFTISGQMNDASVESNGGDVVIDNKGVYTATTDSVRTSGTGKITINQANGGSLQNAIDSMRNTGSGLNTLKAFAGTYNENVDVTITNFLLSGANAGKAGDDATRGAETIINGAYTRPTINSVKNNTHIDGVKIVGGTDGVSFSGDDASVKNSIISNQSGNGIVFNTVERGEIARNKIESLGQDGVRLEASNKITVSNNTIGSLGDDGIDARNTNNLVIKKNKIGNLGDNGVTVDGSNDVDLEGNEIFGLGGNGVFVTNVKNLDVTNENIIRNLAKSGILATKTKNINIDNNDIRDLGMHGIELTSFDDAVINNNDVLNIGQHGIFVRAGKNVATITKNNVTNVGEDGILVNNVTTANVNNNIIKNAGNAIDDGGIVLRDVDVAVIDTNNIDGAGWYGIAADGVDKATIINNIINDTGGPGIFSRKSKFDGTEPSVLISGNKITNTDGTGISVTDFLTAHVLDNTIDKTGSFGIWATADFTSEPTNTDNSRVLIQDNTVSNNLQNAIRVNNVKDITITENKADTTRYVGVRVHDFDTASITDNEVTGAGRNGIDVRNGKTRLTMTDNTVNGAGIDGIYVENAADADLRRNTISNVGDDGISAVNMSGSQIINNTISNFGDDGITSNGGSDIRIARNTVHNGGDNGILVEDATNVRIRNNEVYSLGGDGIETNYVSNSKIRDNEVYFVGGNGILSANGDDVHVFENLVRNLGGDGIAFDTMTNSIISANTVRDLAGNGISTKDGETITINGKNDIRRVGKNGISSNGTEGLTVEDNDIRRVGMNGIYAANVDDGSILNNRVRDTAQDGIAIVGGDEIVVSKNNVRRANANGISSDGTSTITVLENNVYDAGQNGISLANFDRADILSNFVEGSGDDGINAVGGSFLDFRGTVRILDNNVLDSNESGIEVFNVETARIRENDVTGSGNNGIAVYGFDKARIRDNNVTDSGANGILADNGFDLIIRKNDVIDSDQDGIRVTDMKDRSTPSKGMSERSAGKLNSRVWIINNNVTNSKDDGIDVENADRVVIRNNDVTDSKRDGVSLIRFKTAEITKNKIINSGDDGIDVRSGRESLLITNNTVKRSEDDGIFVRNAKGTSITNNTIKNADGDGIETDRLSGAQVSGNELSKVDGNGIVMRNGDIANVATNIIEQIGQNGVLFVNMIESVLSGNTITSAQANGIMTSGGDDIQIDDNTITGSGENGVLTFFTNNVTISNNRITDSFANGVLSRGFGGFWELGDTQEEIIAGRRDTWNITISDNIITESGNDGVGISGFDNIQVNGNEISDSVNNGLFIFGPNNGYVNVEGNVFTDNDIGAHFESGLVDLTGVGNEFINGRVGLRFAPYQSPFMDDGEGIGIVGEIIPAFFEDGGPKIPRGFRISPLELVDNDGPGVSPPSQGIPTNFGGTIGEQLFDGQTLYFVELANGAFFEPGTPTWLNGLNSTYRMGDGTLFRPSTTNGVLNAEQFAFLESRFFHFSDDPSLGRFFFGFIPAINQEDIFNQFDQAAIAAGNVRVTILGLPRVSGGTSVTGPAANVASLLNNLTPFAGGDGNNAPQDFSNLTPDMLNQIEAAAGGGTSDSEGAGNTTSNSTSCWSDAVVGAQQGQVTSFTFGGQLGISDVDSNNNCATQ